MSHSIILYEDNQLLSESIQSMLRLNERVELRGAFDNPLHVISHLQAFKPDLLIMDIDKTSMDGIKAVKSVRATKSPIPILMLTVFDDNTHVIDEICAGASGYLLI